MPANLADRLGDDVLTLIELLSGLAIECFDDVSRGDGAIQLALFAGLGLERERDSAQTLSERLGAGRQTLLAPHLSCLPRLVLLKRTGGGFDSQPVRDQ